MKGPLFAVVVLVACSALAGATVGTAITDANLQSAVLDDSNVWLVEFASAMCGSCKEFAPEWEKLSTQVKRIKCGSVDIDDAGGKALAEKLGIMDEGIPNLKLVHVRGSDLKAVSVTLVKGDAPSARQLRKKLKPLIKGLQKDGDGKFLKAEEGSQAAPPAEEAAVATEEKSAGGSGGADAASGNHVGTPVNVDNFKSVVEDSVNVWVLEFMSGKCGSCAEFAPIWEKTAGGLNRLQIGSVDIDDPRAMALAQQLGVLAEGIPAVKLVRAGGSVSEVMKGGGDLMSVKQLRYALKKGLAGLAKDAGGKFLKEGQEGAAKAGGGAPAAPAGKQVRADTLELTDADFHSTLKAADGSPFLVEFYAPWCGNCKRLAPYWEKLGKQINADAANPVTVVKVDAVAQTKLAGEFGVKSYPTIRSMGYAGGKLYSVDFALRSMKGGQELETLASFAKDNADVKAGQEKQEEEKRAKEAAEKKAAEDQEAAAAAQPADAPVRILTDSTYAAAVDKVKANDGHQLFVKFYAPWCGHCKALAPKWKEAGEKLKDNAAVTFADVDCTVQKSTCSKEGVTSYPFLIKFNKGNMGGEWPGDVYEKKHETDEIVKFALAGTGKDEL
jgi:thioredoxin-like negative regulator of GroEL